jgi:2,3-bisphosphoglycerate-dependent phosphoglycerate mutase
MELVLWMSNQARRCSETAKDLQGDVPGEESLGDTLVRVLPCWEGAIAPELQARRRVLLAAQGNSLWALVKYLDGLTEDEVAVINIPTGIPLAYHLDESLRPIDHHYVGDSEAIAAATETSHRTN